jgi:hypothetical protein
VRRLEELDTDPGSGLAQQTLSVTVVVSEDPADRQLRSEQRVHGEWCAKVAAMEQHSCAPFGHRRNEGLDGRKSVMRVCKKPDSHA